MISVLAKALSSRLAARTFSYRACRQTASETTHGRLYRPNVSPLPEKNPRFSGNSKYRSFAVARLGVPRAVRGRCDRDELVRIVAFDRIGVIISGKRKE